MLDEIANIFESNYRRIIEIRNEYAKKIAEEIDKHRCDNCKYRGDCDDETWMNCKKNLDEIIERLEIEEADREGDVFNVIEDEIRKLGFEVELGFDYDANCYFTAPGYPREYRFYNVYEYHKVIDTNNKKVYLIVVKTKKLNKPWITEYAFGYMAYDEYELVNEETPFTKALVESIPWDYIRPEWAGNIHDFINTLAKAEREGRLEEALREVIRRVENGLWIYDYKHFYNALFDTCGKFNIKLDL